MADPAGHLRSAGHLLDATIEELETALEELPEEIAAAVRFNRAELKVARRRLENAEKLVASSGDGPPPAA